MFTTPSVIPPSPQPVTLSHLPQVLPTGSNGVSFTPQGRGYAKMDNHSGSVESLSTLSTYSFGSTISSSGNIILTFTSLGIFLDFKFLKLKKVPTVVKYVNFSLVLYYFSFIVSV